MRDTPGKITHAAGERLTVFRRVRDAVAERIDACVRQDQEESTE